MDGIHYQLSVLSKAIHYKNLSGAASHVGISQPQLSRIISRLESELGIILLDRTARRKSGWTPLAYKIAETYFRSSRKLTQSLQQLTTDDQITQLTIGTLEGLAGLAMDFCSQVFEMPKIQVIELNVFELNELEEHFEKDEMDLIFSCREPGKHKYRNVRHLGHQVIEKRGDGSKTRVYSQFEYANYVQAQSKRQPSKDTPVLLSNSLMVRKSWIDEHGGTGNIPSDVRRRKGGEADAQVVLVASDLLNPALWQKFEQLRL